MITVALNGFGRIGRNFLRAYVVHKPNFNLAAINLGPADPKDLIYAVTYDSLMGPLHADIKFENGTLTINQHKITIVTERDPEKLPWKNLNIDWVVEATGKFTKKADALAHVRAGAKKALVTAPMKDDDVSIIPGVNQQVYKPEHVIVSLGSCTTNALAPMLHVLHTHYHITQAAFTTVHAYTNTQALLDVENKKTRLSRAAAVNMIPSTTGATEVIGKIIPDLEGHIIGHAIRVPLTKVSLIDVVVTLKKPASAQDINNNFAHAAHTSLKNILALTHEPLVSSDFFGNSHSVIIDGLLTSAQGTTAKVFGWYDNEWGYTIRLQEFLQMNSAHL